MAFEWADSMDDFWQDIVDPDIHVPDMETLEGELLVENARDPAWSR